MSASVLSLVVATTLGFATGSPAPTAPDAGDAQVKSFRTEVKPRVDPVFGGVAALRTAIDEFLALEGDMKKARDDLSTAVHDAIVQLRPMPAPPPAAGSPTATTPAAAPTCPPGALAAHGKARESGRRFLALGRRFEARFHEIRRGLGVGDTVALTPDYRWKAGKARELYGELLRDYQEMRAAFHDQLDAELRHAGCKIDPAAVASGRPIVVGAIAPEAGGPDPENPEDWTLAAPDEPIASPPKGAGNASLGNRASRPAAKASNPESGPAIWIEIDNTRCARPSSFTLDGQSPASIPAAKKVQIRTHAGPHALCVLPATEKRVCGATGTVRRVYLFEGWSMAVRCTK